MRVASAHPENKTKNRKQTKLQLIFVQWQGITFQEYLDFYKVLKYINDIDTALMFYHVAGASIDKGM